MGAAEDVIKKLKSHKCPSVPSVSGKMTGPSSETVGK
jgi:hypothetical protein